MSSLPRSPLTGKVIGPMADPFIGNPTRRGGGLEGMKIEQRLGLRNASLDPYRGGPTREAPIDVRSDGGGGMNDPRTKRFADAPPIPRDQRMVMPNPDGSLYVHKGGRLGNFDTPPLRPKMGDSPFASSFRKDLASQGSNPDFMGGIGGMLQQYRSQIANRGTNRRAPMSNVAQQAIPQAALNQLRRDSNLGVAPQASNQAATPNPFAGNEQYQAMMEYQKSMQPQQEQMDRMNELRTAFEGTGGYKDYRISQMEQQLQQRQRQNPRMGMGLGGMRPTGMGMYGGMPRPQQNVYGGQRGFGGNPNNYGGGQQGGYGMPQMPQRNPYQQGGYGQQQGGYGMQGGYGQQPQNQYQQQQYQQPQQQYQSPYQQPRPQPQQFGGYGMGQSSQGGYGGYGGMSNAYAPQQYGQQSMGQPQQFGRMY